VAAARGGDGGRMTDGAQAGIPHGLRQVRAIAATEFRLRLRSPATWVAVAAFVAGFWLWLPSPDGRAVNLSWRTAEGVLQTPRFTSHLVGLACAELCGVILPLVGFYLIAGSIRADERRKLGPIFAASPLTSPAYLLGKALGHTGYLLTLSFLGVATGTMAFLGRAGASAFGDVEWTRLFGPAIWVTLPVAFFVATLAVLFDVTPGLRGPGGWVAWFFAFTFFFIAIPTLVSRGGGRPDTGDALPGAGERPRIYDPSAIAGITGLIAESLPNIDATSLSSGHVIHDERPEVVEWNGVVLTNAFRMQRLLTILQAAAPLLFAWLLFDRFDPARARRRSKKVDDLQAISTVGASAAERSPSVHWSDLLPIEPRPSFVRSLAAEVQLGIEALGRWRWLLLAAALASPWIPGFAAAAVLLVVLTPLLAAAGAREPQAGTLGLVRAQPGLPTSVVLWKAAALATFALLVLLPLIVRAALERPLAGLAAAAGAALLGGLAAAAGSLTGGGKLFAGLHVAAIYLALNGLRAGDATGLLTAATAAAPASGRLPDGPAGVLFFAVGTAALLATAWASEARRRTA
jgi:hypothetical protein